MDFLLDTHTILWFLNGDEKLSNAAGRIITDGQNNKFVSLVSVWEAAIKISTKKLYFPNGAKGFLEAVKSNFLILPIGEAHIVESGKLPWHHRDPFDRLLIASAIVENMTIITTDQNIPLYAVHCSW